MFSLSLCTTVFDYDDGNTVIFFQKIPFPHCSSFTNRISILFICTLILTLIKLINNLLLQNTKYNTAVKLTVVPCPPVVEVKIRRPDTKYQLGFSVQNGVVSIHCSLVNEYNFTENQNSFFKNMLCLLNVLLFSS